METTQEIVLHKVSSKIVPDNDGDATYGGAFTSTGKAVGALTYVAKKLGVSDRNYASMAELRKHCDKDAVKAANKELQLAKTRRAIQDTKVWALIGADPNQRKFVRATFNKKGVLIGFSGRSRFQSEQKAKAMSKDARIAMLEAKLASAGIVVS